MGIQQNFELNLEAPEIFAFLKENTETSIRQKPSARPGFTSASLSLPVGTLPKSVSLSWARREFYEILEGWDLSAGNNGTVISRFDLYVPITQKINIEIYADLFYKDGISDQQKSDIQADFVAYNASSGQDVLDYLVERIQLNQHGVTASMIDISCGALLTKDGSTVEHLQSRNAILAPYTGGGGGFVQTPNGPNDIHGEETGYFVQRKFKIRLLNTEMVSTIPPKQSNNHIIETTGDPTKLINQIAEAASAAANCDGQFVTKQHKVATILRIPEFKIDWRLVTIRVGCVEVRFHLPFLQIRMSNLDLDAYTRYPRDLHSLVEGAILNCVWEAALAGAVIGVALLNFAAAAAAFEAVFVGCLKRKFGEFISCMIPGLVLIVRPGGPWADVL